MKRFGKLLLSGTVTLALLGALIGAAPEHAPIRIGSSLSLTGTYAALGQNQHRGYQLCAKHVNEKGGILGRTIEFVFYDDQSQPATGVRLQTFYVLNQCPRGCRWTGRSMIVYRTDAGQKEIP